MTTPTPNYERFGEATETCTVCGKTKRIARFKMTGERVAVIAAMCPPCTDAYKAGQLPTHPYWTRTPEDPPGPRTVKRS